MLILVKSGAKVTLFRRISNPTWLMVNGLIVNSYWGSSGRGTRQEELGKCDLVNYDIEF
ncbi:MAG: hypothetical protein PSX81_01295 [bacterium]|nr:hypothetical protein [bacterium]